MNRTILLLSVILSYSNGHGSDTEHLCFVDPNFQNEKLCYPIEQEPGRSQSAKDAVKHLANNLDSPNKLVAIEGKMREHYNSEEKIARGLNNNISKESLRNIYELLTVGQYSIVLLEDNSSLVFNHASNKFIFSYEHDPPIQGATYYHGKGYKSAKVSLGITKSNCNLHRDGIYFLSPPKESFLYQKGKTTCGYNGRYFSSINETLKIGRFDQIDQGYTVLHGNFHKFIIWLYEKS